MTSFHVTVKCLSAGRQQRSKMSFSSTACSSAQAMRLLVCLRGGVTGHWGSEEWAVNDRKIPHTFSTRSTQNTDLSCPPWVLAHRRH